jgi:uncharacterized protein
MTARQTTAARNAVNWFEIPVRDLDRAQRFYETVLGKPLRRESMGPQTLAVMPYTQPGVGGALMAGPAVPPPAESGTVVYLDVSPSLDAAVARATAAGATLLTPRVNLPDGMGAFAIVRDCEGNRIGLHEEG